MSEMIRSFPNRPSVLRIHGCTIYMSVHDQEYFRQKAAWLHKIKDSHPDRQAMCQKPAKRRSWSWSTIFRCNLKSYRAWKLQERHWYWQFQMMPPDWKGPSIAPLKRNCQFGYREISA